MYSDQPTMPSSVVTFRKELTRQPASQCRSSILVIFIVNPWQEGCRNQLQRPGESRDPFFGARECGQVGPGFRRDAGVGDYAKKSSSGGDFGEHRFEIGQEQSRVLAHREMAE